MHPVNLEGKGFFVRCPRISLSTEQQLPNVTVLNRSVLLNIIGGQVHVEIMSISLDFCGPPTGCQVLLKGVRLDIKWLLIEENDTV